MKQRIHSVKYRLQNVRYRGRKEKGVILSKVFFFIGTLIVLSGAFGYFFLYYDPLTSEFALPDSSSIHVCFSPEEGCEKVIIQALDAAHSEVLVQAYVLTSVPITDALIKAARRGVQVSVLYDKGQSHRHNSKIPLLKTHHIYTKIDPANGSAHNKIMIIDGEKVLTGSYNFSSNANLKNAENLLTITHKDVARAYRDHWMARFKKASAD